MTSTAARAAFISGGGGGIGKATAHKLASRGILTVIVDMNEQEGHKVADGVAKKWDVKTKFLKVDITQERQITDAVVAATEWTGRIDYAANCAGICESVWAEEESITAELFERTYAINTKAGLAAYTPSKYASIGVTKNGAKFYGPEGIRVNALYPAWTLTKMVPHSMGKEGIIGSK